MPCRKKPSVTSVSPAKTEESIKMSPGKYDRSILAATVRSVATFSVASFYKIFIRSTYTSVLTTVFQVNVAYDRCLAGFWHELSYSVLKRNSGIYKNKSTSLWNFVLNSIKT